eukprot:1005364-Pleurochrysis_carterae.AAC.2
MKVQSAKAKGRRLQQEVVTHILKAFPQLHSDDVRSTSMGVSGEDVQLSHAARQLLPYSFECKNCERLNVWAAIEQARRNSVSVHVTPVVVMKKNNEHPYVVLPIEHFFTLVATRHS